VNLRVGIIGTEPGWQQLLLREGIPHADAQPPFGPAEYAALVVGDSADRRAFAAVRSYVNGGGAVLTSSKHAATVAGLIDKRIRVDSFIPSADKEFSAVALLDVFGTVHVPERANLLFLESREKAAFLGREGSGHVMVLPFDAPSLIADERARTKSFYAPARRLPFERVSTVSKGEVRQFVSRCLELLYHRRGVPFVHSWYHPEGAKTVFAFRVDADEADESSVRDLYRLADEERIPMTWFLHVERQREFLGAFTEMRDQEVGVHCYAHRTFEEADAIRKDVRTALDRMRHAGLAPRGYAAPYGVWSRTVGEALRDMEFAYSSEFSFSYDDLPLVPSLGGGRPGILQVPIHPVCLGTMRRHSYSEEQAFAYFDLVLRRCVRSGAPAFFYHHPKDGHPAVLRRLFARVREEELPLMTLGAYADWWNARQRFTLHADYADGRVKARGTGGPADIRMRISTPDGREACVRTDGEYPLEGPGWKAVPDASPNPPDLFRARAFNYRIPLVKGLDAVTRMFKRKD
jgi:hypothetical protein